MVTEPVHPVAETADGPQGVSDAVKEEAALGDWANAGLRAVHQDDGERLFTVVTVDQPDEQLFDAVTVHVPDAPQRGADLLILVRAIERQGADVRRAVAVSKLTLHRPDLAAVADVPAGRGRRDHEPVPQALTRQSDEALAKERGRAAAVVGVEVNRRIALLAGVPTPRRLAVAVVVDLVGADLSGLGVHRSGAVVAVPGRRDIA